jgi:hypothetical protein
MVRSLEQVRVDLQGDVRVCVAELTGDEDDVQASGDQQRGIAVAKRVEGEPTARRDAAALAGSAKVVADVAMIEPAAAPVAKDKLVLAFEGRGEPAFTQQLRDRGGEDDVTLAGFGIERNVLSFGRAGGARGSGRRRR